MKASEAIKEALPIFLQYGNLKDEDLLDIFIKKGFPPDIARKIVVFMPLAFGRVMMNELKVETSDEFEYFRKKGTFTDKQRRKLNNIAIYREAFVIASRMSQSDDEDFWAVAGRSAEINAVNHLKAQGSKPHNIVLTPMLTMWELEEEPPPNYTDSIQAAKPQPTSNKNWWEFWK